MLLDENISHKILIFKNIITLLRSAIATFNACIASESSLSKSALFRKSSYYFDRAALALEISEYFSTVPKEYFTDDVKKEVQKLDYYFNISLNQTYEKF